MNYDSLPVIKPQCPYHTYNKDGAMRFDGNGGGAVNYEPNSFGGPTQEKKFVELPKEVSGTVARHDHRSDADYYTQPGNLFRLLEADGAADWKRCGKHEGNPAEYPGTADSAFLQRGSSIRAGVAKGLGLDVEAVVDKKLATSAADRQFSVVSFK